MGSDKWFKDDKMPAEVSCSHFVHRSADVARRLSWNITRTTSAIARCPTPSAHSLQAVLLLPCSLTLFPFFQARGEPVSDALIAGWDMMNGVADP